MPPPRRRHRARPPAFNFQRPWRKWPEQTADGRKEGCVRRPRREPTSQDGWARTRWTPRRARACVRSVAAAAVRPVSPEGNQLQSGFQRGQRVSEKERCVGDPRVRARTVSGRDEGPFSAVPDRGKYGGDLYAPCCILCNPFARPLRS